jgi:hypothetical protein
MAERGVTYWGVGRGEHPARPAIAVQNDTPVNNGVLQETTS